MIKFLDLHSQYLHMQSEIDKAIAGVIRDSAFIGGEVVETFERRFAAYQQAEHCVGVGNGTDAIEIVLEAMNFPRGGEVIVPANTFIATSEAVTRSGCKVVFADVDPVTYTLDVADVHSRITSRTVAIIAVHLYGHPCDMDGLMALARESGLKLIEDCAQAHGAEYKGRRVGAIGHAGTFSFYPGKNLGAYGDGGAITTNDERLARQCRMIANHGRVDKYDHQFEGRNSRLDGLQAAILTVKLRYLDAWINRRNEVASFYTTQLDGIDGLTLPRVADGCRHAFHLFVVRTASREALAAFLKEGGIQTGVHYPIALPKLQAYRYLGEPDQHMFANRNDGHLLSLPIGEHLTEQELVEIADAVKTFCLQAVIA
ncbi:erythromycin biosynthesis sensory transduction protein eryC1 [Pollutimonas nitritireducens]|uniref:Erythromycin biosynthesis sensory transduction protein eryC1 n=1 Tax=Pollutimonas nitritireducens TaxID=2045209 RepID=A0A2N4UDA2_9BURK|nr:DegT/DnrJ/EryC1/StrS family aminotransferase [Pollutimonas nitritireducens]PLC52999.1 erythromycin biosynthesis sensory transduction protein eryC1 [Pollutimonas nitritireducens]